MILKVRTIVEEMEEIVISYVRAHTHTSSLCCHSLSLSLFLPLSLSFAYDILFKSILMEQTFPL